MQGKKFPVRISFEAVDNLTSAVQRINAQIKTATNPTRRFMGSMSNLGKALNLQSIGDAFGNVRNSLGDVAGGVTRLGIAAAAASAGTFALVKSYVDAADEIGETAQKLGIGSRHLQELRFAADMAGTPIEALDTGIKLLSKNMAEAAKGSGDTADVFRALGVNLKNPDKSLRNTNDVINDLADRFATLKKGPARTALAMKIFGKSGAEMVPLLAKGSAGIEAFRKRAHKLGVVMGDDLLNSGSAFDDLMKELGGTFRGVRNVLGAALLPAFTSLGTTVRDFLIENRQAISDFGKALGEALVKLMPSLTDGLKSLTAAMQAFSALPANERADLIAKALKGLAALAILPTLLSMGKLIFSIMQFGWAVGSVLMRAFMLWNTGMVWVKSGLFLLQRAFFAFGPKIAAILAGIPIWGWVVAAVIALGFLLWKWKEVVEFIKGAWNTFAGFIAGVWDWVKALGSVLGILWDIGKAALSIGSKSIDVNQNVTTTGNPLGAQSIVSNANGVKNQNEVAVKVDFANMPRGSIVSTQKNSGVDFDLGMGYSMVN